MRCSACQAEIPDESAQCPVCEGVQTPASKPRKARRRSESDVEADLARAAAYNHEVKRIVLVCLLSILPGLGLVLAPIVIVLTSLVLRRGRGDRMFTAAKGARVTLYIAILTTACNWAGLGLIAWSYLGAG